jgi:oligoendopeptidase F
VGDVKEVPGRGEIPDKYKWRLETIYPDDDAWEEDFRAAEADLPQLEAFRGEATRSAQSLLDCLLLRDRVFERVGRLYAYAHMRHDEDTTVARYEALHSRAVSLHARALGAASFLEPEVVALPDDVFEEYLASSKRLGLYERYLRQIRRMRDHVRSAEVEALLAELSEVGSGPSQIYHALVDADLVLPEVVDEEGRRVRLTQARYLRFLQSEVREVRKAAFEAMHGTYRSFARTVAAAWATQLKADRFFARARRYPDTLTMALDQNEVPPQVYQNLVEAVHRHLPALGRYLELRRRLLGVDRLHMYDLYAPLVSDPPGEIPWEEASATVVAALAPLGEDYVAEVRTGLASGWVDVLENRGKRSGAYSSGSYGTQPFILMNYDGTMDSMYTLAHELGHSLHSLYTRRNQPFVYGDYTIFVAEVASTMNEALLSHHLLATREEPSFRLYVLNHDLEHFRTTLFRQTLFAEFEAQIHRMVEDGQPVTQEKLAEVYFDLNRMYYGEVAESDPLVAYEWARIPHFYSSFYVYQYATGISAATALSEQVLNEGPEAARRYREFLTLGSRLPPLDLLRVAGVDMATPDPIDAALGVFEAKLEAFARLAEGPQAAEDAPRLGG